MYNIKQNVNISNYDTILKVYHTFVGGKRSIVTNFLNREDMSLLKKPILFYTGSICFNTGVIGVNTGTARKPNGGNRPYTGPTWWYIRAKWNLGRT